MSFLVHKSADGTFKSKNGEHYNAAYEGEETNQNLSSSDTSNASSEPYASFSADELAYIRDRGSYQEINSPKSSINSNPGKTEKCMTTHRIPSNENVDDPAYTRDSGSYQDINTPTSSINSNSGKKDVTTEKPDIHVPSNENDFPNFKNSIFKAQFKKQQKTRDIFPVPTSHFICNNITDRPRSIAQIEEESDPHADLKSKKNCHWRKWFVFVFICVCVSGVAAWIVQKEYGSKKETPEDPPTPSLIVDKCENDISTATVGEPICIPYTQQFTSNPSGIQVKQVSSQYFSVLPSFSINVSSDTVSQTKENWIVYFNISRPDQQLRFMKENATCHSIGIYEITIKYDDGNFTSFKFNISFKDPQLKQSVTRINDNIHVHCEMKKTCMASSLALFVNDGGSSRLIPDIDVCSYTDKNSGTTVSADAIIHVSQLSENQTISCVPLMTNMELSANLTSTSGIPLCEGDCVPDCKDNPQGEAYFPDKNDCTQFYQCSNGQLVSQSCSPSTYWSTSECTCVHFDDEICNRDTNRFLSPLLSIEKCTNASLV